MGLAIWAMLRYRAAGHLDRYPAAGACGAIYPAAAPALAPQHTVFPGVLLFASDLRAGVTWGLLSGAMCLVYYLFHWDGTFPMKPIAQPHGPAPTMLLGMLAWGWVTCYAWRAVARRGQQD